MVQSELELLQLHVNTHPKTPIPIVLLMSGRLLSGELVARRLYHKSLSALPNAEQLVTIDSRSDGHIYLSSNQQILKIDLRAVEGFGPGTPIGKTMPAQPPASTAPAPGSAPPKKPAT